ncbi:MAG: B12-binding domain-containing radical SAM protein [Myxococcota bacterium]
MKALLVIPSIFDFAAHDMWAAPYGLMVIASSFKRYHIEFDVLDLLGSEYVKKEYSDGRRRYKRKIIDFPEALKDRGIKRFFAVYGADMEEMDRRIDSLPPSYKLIVISTTMTYWYYGYKILFNKLKDRFKSSTFAIGGVYTSLLKSHAKSIFEDSYIFPNDRLGEFDRLVSELYNIDFSCFNKPFADWELPDIESFSYRRYIPVLLMRGCPFRCTYCASRSLIDKIESREPLRLADWVIFECEKSGIKDIALFDDAFLFNHKKNAVPFLKRIIESKKGLRIHASNGLHPRFIDEEMASLMKESGFETIRLSLESADDGTMRITGGKVKREEYENAIKFLMKSGYKKSQLGTYLICGIPNQSPQEVIDSIRYVDDVGGVAYLAEFSPIPGTELFYEAEKISRFDLNEPLWQNNTLMSYWNPFFNEDILNEIKAEVIKRRREPTTGFEPVTY